MRREEEKQFNPLNRRQQRKRSEYICVKQTMFISLCFLRFLLFKMSSGF